MATKIEQLIAQQKQIEEAIAAEKNKGRADAVAKVKELIRTYGITAREVKSVLVARKTRSGGAKRPAAKKTARKSVRK